MMKDREEIKKEGTREGRQSLALYGAGMVAVSVFYAIKTLYKHCQVIYFIVSQKEGNPAEIDGVPVISLDELCDLETKQNLKILVATPENHHTVIAKNLENRGLKGYICVDSRKEAALMEQYYRFIKQFPTLRAYPSKHSLIHDTDRLGIEVESDSSAYNVNSRSPCLDVYMTRFHRDTTLKSSYTCPSWIHPIQAGADLTEERVADLQDNIGYNISKKNVNYCELTVLYWIWKNVGNQDWKGSETSRQKKESHCLAHYLGLFHYRRILDMEEEDLYRLGANGIDVILPYPTIHYPSIDEHRRRYVKDEDWEAMVRALEELAPEYTKRRAEIFSQPYFYNYNMFIARETIFKEFCGWLFPILARTEELSSPRGWERADRYIGYLGENLTTLYFICHRDDFKTAHTGRLMLI